MKDKDDCKKIAIDIKTTYRSFKKNGKPKGYGFTLGSYASFMRNGKKNIMFPYNQYAKHYVIGFVYTRNTKADEGQIYRLKELDRIPVPYKDVEVFVQEKYKIAGEKPGSGDTENIGSYKTNNMDYLINGEGPFSVLCQSVFEQYWACYPKYREVLKNYTTLAEYFAWCEEMGQDADKLKRTYARWKMQHTDK